MDSKLKNKKINLSVQLLHLKRLFPDSHAHIQRDRLTWEHKITPSQLSQSYTVRLAYKFAKPPQVNVLDPELIAPEGKRLPHTYPGKRLCLYYPGIGNWRGDMLLAETIVPWISEWLYYYEIWLVTGERHGGGAHPELNF